MSKSAVIGGASLLLAGAAAALLLSRSKRAPRHPGATGATSSRDGSTEHAAPKETAAEDPVIEIKSEMVLAYSGLQRVPTTLLTVSAGQVITTLNLSQNSISSLPADIGLLGATLEVLFVFVHIAKI